MDGVEGVLAALRRAADSTRAEVVAKRLETLLSPLGVPIRIDANDPTTSLKKSYESRLALIESSGRRSLVGDPELLADRLGRQPFAGSNARKPRLPTGTGHIDTVHERMKCESGLCD